MICIVLIMNMKWNLPFSSTAVSLNPSFCQITSINVGLRNVRNEFIHSCRVLLSCDPLPPPDNNGKRQYSTTSSATLFSFSAMLHVLTYIWVHELNIVQSNASLQTNPSLVTRDAEVSVEKLNELQILEILLTFSIFNSQNAEAESTNTSSKPGELWRCSKYFVCLQIIDSFCMENTLPVLVQKCSWIWSYCWLGQWTLSDVNI